MSDVLFSNRLRLDHTSVGIPAFSALVKPYALGLSDKTYLTGNSASIIACKFVPEPDSNTTIPDTMPPSNLSLKFH